MAEALFRELHKDRQNIRVLSAGVATMDGQQPSANSVQAMAVKGMDITKLRSNMITAELVEEADYILGMTRSHVDAVNAMFPSSVEKTFLLREFDETLDPYEQDVADPIGGSFEIYMHCRDQIEQGILTFSKYLKKMESQTDLTSPSDTDKNVTNIAIGADHGGFEMKNALRAHLQGAGANVLDCGTDSAESTDYPDFAKKVATAVASGEQSLGILVCRSGIGMSIAANKVPGARAALISDAEAAALSRRHNDANVLCLGADGLTQDSAIAIVDAFLNTPFEGGRHERRVGKLEGCCSDLSLANVDPVIANLVNKERDRQQENIELIASENFTSPAVIEATGSVLTNKYAEGYPAKRWYGGCEHVDEVENLAIDRAKELFGAEFANVQPHCGSATNMAVYFSTLKPGDKILTMDLSHGGHLTHGNAANFSGKFFEVVHYGVSKENETIDYDQLAAMAEEHKPKMITVGASAYPRVIDFARMGAIAQSIGAYLLADIAHIAGMVAAGVHPSPVPHADFVTTTTHKTLRGPRGGLILCKEEYGKKINSQVFPGIQGGPLMHVIAAKAVCFKEALTDDFKSYQQQIVKNAKALADGLSKNGFRLVSGGTDNHLMLVDVGEKDITGKICQQALDEAGITVNKNTIPFETRSPFQASGIRVGTPAVTTRGMKEAEMAEIADMISEVLADVKNLDAAKAVRQRVHALTARFQLPY